MNGRRFTTQLHHNPAYGNPDHSAQETVSAVQNHTNPHSDGQQIASSAPQAQDLTMNHNHSRREFDHIYESIKWTLYSTNALHVALFKCAQFRYWSLLLSHNNPVFTW